MVSLSTLSSQERSTSQGRDLAVQFSNRRKVDKAIECLNRFRLFGYRVFVSDAKYGDAWMVTWRKNETTRNIEPYFSRDGKHM
ncbi:hypothetical protein V6N13_055060 [Hibiscus sabdariffa]